MDGDSDLLEVKVADNGTGISEDNKSNLFKLYGFLSDTSEINTRGIGLGLYICKMITKQLGGDIVCESVLGVGTTFTFVVKLATIDEAQLDSESDHAIISNPFAKTDYPKVQLEVELS